MAAIRAKATVSASLPATVVLGLGSGDFAHDWLVRFFTAIGESSLAAWVVVYEAGQQEGLTAHLTAACRLPVRRIKNHLPVAAGAVYIAPRHANVRLVRNRFRVALKNRVANPIDGALDSLAEAAADPAIGILIADDVSDGRWGLEAIRSAGGMGLHVDSIDDDAHDPERVARIVLERLATSGADQHRPVPPEEPPAPPIVSSTAATNGIENVLAGLQLRERALAAASCGILIADMRRDDQPLIYANEGFERITGYAPSRVVGHNCRVLQGDETDPASVAAMREAIEQRRELTVTLINYRADGTRFWNELRLTPVRDDHDVTTHYVGIMTDVTARVAVEDALKRRELQLRTLLDSTAEAIYGLDLEGRCTFCNPACVRMLGYDRAEDLIGQHMHALIHHSRADGNTLSEDECILYRAFIAEEEAHSVTEYFWRKDGSGFPVECWSYPIREDGKVTGAVVTFLDITSRSEVAAQLLERTRALETINRINVALTAELDLSKLVQQVTDAGREIIGAEIGAFFYNVQEESGESYMLYTLSGASQRDFEGMPMPRGTPIFEPTFSGTGVVRAADITKDPCYGKNPPFTGMPDGHPPVRSYLAMPVTSRTGKVLGGLLFGHRNPGVFTQDHEDLLGGLAAQAAVGIDNARLFEAAQREITERRQAEVALEEARQAADRANAAKSSFLANMSHEIRTPMTAILGYSEILAAHLKDAENRDCVDVIQRNGRFLLDIVDDILDLSRIEAGELPVKPQRVTLAELVADVRSLMEVRAQEKGLPLRLVYRGLVPSSIETDMTRLRQILVNLISNAVKFTTRGEVRLEVTYVEGDAANDEPQLLFDVVDTGIGMTKVQIDKIFQPFRQADDSITREFGGTGLGLAISRRLAEMLGGQIDVDSEPGEGSRFRLTLPVSFVAGAELVEPDADISGPAALDESLHGKLDARILVVDDRRDIRYLAQYFLEEAGARVSAAENGQAALDIVQQFEQRGHFFDLVLMDMQMPVMDGFEATRQLRKRGFGRPIVALTAGAMNIDKASCLAAGCDAHIAKPIEGSRLVRLVSEQLNGAGAADDGRTGEAANDAGRNHVSVPAKTQSRADPARKTVLIVDDSRDSCRALARLLELRGYHVGQAYDGAGALNAAGELEPDVVILDLGLPDMSGYDVAAALRERASGSHAVLIALSGRTADRERFDAAGFDHHVMKPAGAGDLEPLFGQRAERHG